MFIGIYKEMMTFLVKENGDFNTLVFKALLDRHKGFLSGHNDRFNQMEITFPTYGAALNFYHGLMVYAQERLGKTHEEAIKMLVKMHPSVAEKPKVVASVAPSNR